MEAATPLSQHQWLEKLVGTWSTEMTCLPGPGQEPMTSRGTETVRTLGGLWVVCEGRGDAPDGTPVQSIMTIGYDPAKPGFVGTFIASMMTHLWHYAGTIDQTGRTLTLATEGPSMDDPSRMVPYEDIIEFVDDDYRMLRSRLKGSDGEWAEFMLAHYRRSDSGASAKPASAA